MSIKLKSYIRNSDCLICNKSVYLIQKQKRTPKHLNDKWIFIVVCACGVHETNKALLHMNNYIEIPDNRR